MAKILILGSAVIDVIIKVRRLPQAGEDITGWAQGMNVGGCAFNVSKILDHLHCPHDLCVPVGKGMFADKVRQALVESGHPVLITDERCDNGYCLSLVEDDGERTFITMDGIETMWQDAWLEKLSAQDYDYIYVSGYGFQDGNTTGDVLMRFLAQKKPLCKIILDPGPRLIAKRFHKLLQMQTILELNEAEAMVMAETHDLHYAVQRLYAQTKEPIIVTMGSRGTLCYTKKEEIFVPAKTVKAIDTIGAGDSHTAGFIAALSQGKSLKEACEQANAIAAQVVQHSGCSLS